ncbi:DUF2934 domain-containing protein [Acidiphilium sp. PA]|uniref:DUF2934 domain-containing protein n=1 Tax=Acidiphilium sp. PA TaxID=2871705 RepID=UPI002243285A|nr:DUF2934 domain-containing protein [Acidiphilium sp. PA]MCW8305579.1 DUF2934 domain-containing protein [Acidiphilium sp. PA]
MSDQKHEEKVRELAYKLWEEAGKPADRDDEFWHQAHAQIPHPPEAPEPSGSEEPASSKSPLTAKVPAGQA